MMRVCHLNTCPVGIATQDPVLRKKFRGTPEHVVNFFFFVAEELREIMAELGFRTVEEMVGQSDCLTFDPPQDHWKAKNIDLSMVLHKPDMPADIARHWVQLQDHGLDRALDNQLIGIATRAINEGKPVSAELKIRNINRTTGAILSGMIAEKYGMQGLPENTIQFRFTGTAGQSFGAFLMRGVAFTLVGDANDYLAKGLCGGRIVVRPPDTPGFVAENNIIAGNVIAYGATYGEIFLRGVVGERFCVRNSGASAVVEGVGDHGCEYMTGGNVVVIGPTGRNFAAGMSGGIAFVHDPDNRFPARCNMEMVDMENMTAEDEDLVRGLLEKHARYTDSPVAARVLANWPRVRDEFVKVMPRDYKRVLEQRKALEQAAEMIEAGESETAPKA